MTKEEIKERIIELNFYLLTAMSICDKRSIEEIKEEVNDLINQYLANEK
jgi:hypothetical protein